MTPRLASLGGPVTTPLDGPSVDAAWRNAVVCAGDWHKPPHALVSARSSSHNSAHLSCHPKTPMPHFTPDLDDPRTLGWCQHTLSKWPWPWPLSQCWLGISIILLGLSFDLDGRGVRVAALSTYLWLWLPPWMAAGLAAFFSTPGASVWITRPVSFATRRG